MHEGRRIRRGAGTPTDSGYTLPTVAELEHHRSDAG